MVRNAEQEQLRLHTLGKWIAPKYYDYPDGQDLLGKLNYTTKMGLLAGLAFGTLNTFTQRPPLIGNKARLTQMFMKVAPAVGMSFAFTVATYYATVLRKKDDQWNHVIGSLAAGSVFTAAAGPSFGVFGTGVMVAIAVIHKTYRMEGTTAFPKNPPAYSSGYYKRTVDFSLLPDNYKGNWTKELPAQK